METRSKIEKMMHYAIRWTEPDELGVMRLSKVLWFSDLRHFRRYGQTISGLEAYERAKHGPIAPGFYTALDNLKWQDHIVERAQDTPAGVRREFIWTNEPDISDFSVEELETLHLVIEGVKKLSARDVSELTHDALWDELEDGDRMPVAAAAISSEAPSDRAMEWAKRQLN